MNETRFALRRIRPGGRVKIGGRWFRPNETHKPYDGRLDGLVYAFGRYETPGCPGVYEPFVELWGSEALYRADTEADLDAAWEVDPKWVDDGDGQRYDAWAWWDAE